MRASILVVIFDFLVGSFLLFVVAPDTGFQAAVASLVDQPTGAPDFAEEAVSAHFQERENEWSDVIDAMLASQAEAERQANAEKERLEKAQAQTLAAEHATQAERQRREMEEDLRVASIEADAARQNLAAARSERDQLRVTAAEATNELQSAQAALEDAQKRAEEEKNRLQIELQRAQQALQSRPAAVGSESAGVVESGPTAPAGDSIAGSPPTGSLRRGPHQQVVPSRMEVSISMIEEDTARFLDDAWNEKVFPVAFDAGGSRFVAILASSAGLDWRELVGDGDLKDLKVTLGRTAGDNRWSHLAGNDLFIPSADMRVVLLKVEEPPDASMPALRLVGRDEIASKGPPESYLLKATASGTIFRVETSLDQVNRNFLMVSRPALPLREELPWSRDPNKQIEPGDYLVSDTGEVIGVMLDSKVAFILDPTDAEDVAFRLPLSDLAGFVKQARDRRQAMKDR